MMVSYMDGEMADAVIFLKRIYNERDFRVLGLWDTC